MIVIASFYVCIFIDALFAGDVIVPILSMYLMIANFLIISKKKIDLFLDVVYRLNVIGVLAGTLILLNPSIDSTPLILSVVGMFIFYIVSKIVVVDVSILYIGLLIISLFCNTYSLYNSVNENVVFSYLFIAIAHFICLDYLNSSKIYKLKGNLFKSKAKKD